VDASLKVSIAGEHGGYDEVFLLDSLGDGGRERAAIANTGGTPIACYMEAQGF
jgi:hypothetical protein